MNKTRGIKESNLCKTNILSALRSSPVIRSVLLGDDYPSKYPDIDDKSSQGFRELVMHTRPFPYMAGGVPAGTSSLFTEVYITKTAPSIKELKIVVQAVSHRDAACLPAAGLEGTRPDILAQTIEDVLIWSNENPYAYGIGRLCLESADTLSDPDCYGRALTFTVPEFR